jgi:hypothetical protein
MKETKINTHISYTITPPELDDESLAEINTLQQAGYGIDKEIQQELKYLFFHK